MSSYSPLSNLDRNRPQGWTAHSSLESVDQLYGRHTENAAKYRNVRRQPYLDSVATELQTLHTLHHDGALLSRHKDLETTASKQTPCAIQHNLLVNWWSELAAIAISIAALCAMFGLVYPYRTPRAIPNWPSGITLNAVISILSFILRAGIRHCDS